MDQTVTIPAKARAILYYVFGLVNALIPAAAVIYGTDNKGLIAASVFVNGASSVVLGVAGTKVAKDQGTPGFQVVS